MQYADNRILSINLSDEHNEWHISNNFGTRTDRASGFINHSKIVRVPSGNYQYILVRPLDWWTCT